MRRGLPVMGAAAGSRQELGVGGCLPKPYPGGTLLFVLPEQPVQQADSVHPESKTWVWMILIILLPST